MEFQKSVYVLSQTGKKSKFEEPDFSNQIARTRFLEPLFYTFLEKWLQIKWSTQLSGNFERILVFDMHDVKIAKP